MTTMIERVAEAIKHELLRQAKENGDWYSDDSGEEGGGFAFDGEIDLEKLAVVGIAAMRDPAETIGSGERQTDDGTPEAQD